MTAVSILRTLLEILAIILVTYAIYNEGRVSAFEEKIIRAVKYYNHRRKRLKAQEAVRKNRAFILAVDNSSKECAARHSDRAVG